MSTAVEWLLRVWTVTAFVVAVGYLLHEIRALALTDVEREREQLREEHQALERAWLELHAHYPRLARAQGWPELEDGVRISPDGRHTVRQSQGAAVRS